MTQRGTASVRWQTVQLEEHRLRYSVAGCGPAVVLPKKDRGDYVPCRLLADRYTMVQVEPLGFGRSDRPATYPDIAVPEQILAVCDAEGIDEFAVWGFSQGGAMACAVARATPRARLAVCGGFNVLRGLSEAWLARMNRERRIPTGSRAFWNYFHGFNWRVELRGLEAPLLVYAGTQDRQRQSSSERHIMGELGIEVVEFEGLNHRQCSLTDPASPATSVVVDWLERHGWPPNPDR